MEEITASDWVAMWEEELERAEKQEALRGFSLWSISYIKAQVTYWKGRVRDERRTSKETPRP